MRKMREFSHYFKGYNFVYLKVFNITVDLKSKIKFLFPFIISFFLLSAHFSYLNFFPPHFPDKEINENKISVLSVLELDSNLMQIDNVPDTTSQTILLAGDSMVEGLQIFLKEYCKYNGHKFIAHPWRSSTTSGWASKKKLTELINKYNPSYIIFAIGSNELLAKDLEKRKEYLGNIMKESKGRKFVLVGPPNWQKDNGINDIMKSDAGTGSFFDSKEIFLNGPLSSKRGYDRKHPSIEGFRLWTDSIASWIMYKSKNPIKLGKPDIN